LGGTPEQRLHPPLRPGEDSETNTIAVLSCHEVEWSDGTHQKVTGQVMISALGTVGPEFVGGTRVTLSGGLSGPEGPTAPGMFDYAGYLSWRGIYRELRTAGATDWKVDDAASHKGGGWADQFQAWAQSPLPMGL